MTTRNFRVNNGLEVGDITISATANTITGLTTAAPSADGDVANKKYVDDKANITVLNSSVAVADTGSNGTITNTADGGAVLSQTAATTTVTASGAINLTAGTDVVVPANVGVTFGTGEKIEGDNTDLTVTSGAKINLAATSDVHVPQNVGIVFDANGSEKIESNDTDLTINSGAKINLTATSDVHIPQNIGLVFDANGSEKIESNDTDLTISSGAKIKLTATSDVEIPNDVGIAYGTGGEKIESDGTDLTVTSTGVLNLTATGDTAITNNATIGGNLVLTGDLTVNGTTTTVSTTNTTIADNIIELNTGISASSNDAGIIIERGTTGNNAAIIFDESADKFAMGLTTSTAADKSGGITVSTGTLVANLEGNVTGNVTGTADVATVATTVTITDNESTDEDNAMVFTAGGDVDGGNLGLESDGTCTYNPSTGKITATGFVGDLTGTADVATGVTVSANNTANEDIFICLVDGATGTQGIETDTGLKYNPSTNVIASTASSAQYADVAERFEADAPMEAGSVVMVGGSAEITEINSEMSEDVFGVISHKPAYMMNAGAGDNTTHPFVAMTGRTPVRVIGAVTKGQRLVSSSTKGCARTVAQGESISPFNVIGRALESSTDAGIKLVNCAVRTNN